MVRLKFQYTRTYRAAEIGEVEIELEDGFEVDDIQAALATKKFTRCLATGRETDDDTWHFSHALAPDVVANDLEDEE